MDSGSIVYNIHFSFFNMGDSASVKFAGSVMEMVLSPLKKSKKPSVAIFTGLKLIEYYVMYR